MIEISEIKDILNIYKKHGWKLSRVLLSDGLRSSLSQSELDGLFGKEITQSEIDAAWFVRPRKDGGIAWEIRLLSVSPFALCESFPEGFPPEIISGEQKKMENRLIEQAS